jgi:hypothetical protein
LGDWAKRNWKRLAALAVVCIAALLLSLYLAVWRWSTPEGSLRKAFLAVGDGDLEKALSYLDAEGPIGVFWFENRYGVQEKVRDWFQRYQVEFVSLKLESKTQKNFSEVALLGGRVRVSAKDGSDQLAYPVDLASLKLVFYLEKKNGRWLIEGINYDLEELLQLLQL